MDFQTLVDVSLPWATFDEIFEVATLLPSQCFVPGSRIIPSV
jgi:hypothetical protein